TGVGARAAAGGAPAVAAASTEFADSLSAAGTRARVRLGRGPDLEQDRRRAQAGAVAPGRRPGGAAASRTARSGATHDPADAPRRNAGAVRQPAPHLAGDGGHGRATARGAAGGGAASRLRRPRADTRRHGGRAVSLDRRSAGAARLGHVRLCRSGVRRRPFRGAAGATLRARSHAPARGRPVARLLSGRLSRRHAGGLAAQCVLLPRPDAAAEDLHRLPAPAGRGSAAGGAARRLRAGRTRGRATPMNPALVSPTRDDEQDVLSAALRRMRGPDVELEVWSTQPLAKHGKQRVVRYDVHARTAPGGAGVLRDALARLEHAAPPAPAAPSFLHGDFGTANLLWRPGCLVVLDFDRCTRGDPALDLGYLLTQLRRVTLRKPGKLPEFASLWSAILEAYQRWSPPDAALASRVAWYEQATL